ncbi:MAG: hypothetical protein CVU80_02545, partial [Elusimicrobia bacterium HGW-Elusimicrobia-4]
MAKKVEKKSEKKGKGCVCGGKKGAKKGGKKGGKKLFSIALTLMFVATAFAMVAPTVSAVAPVVSGMNLSYVQNPGVVTGYVRAGFLNWTATVANTPAAVKLTVYTHGTNTEILNNTMIQIGTTGVWYQNITYAAGDYDFSVYASNADGWTRAARQN